MLALFILTTFLAIVYSDNCCVPLQWEAMEGLLTGSVDDEGHAAITYGPIRYSYDSTNERTFSSSRLTVGNDTRIYSVLQLFKQNATYIIENNVCVKTHIEPWRPFCIPDNATVIGQYNLGPKNELSVTEYNTSDEAGTYNVGVTNDCVPVVLKIYGNINGENHMIFYGIQNFTMGIADPHVFDVPTICPKVGPPQQAQHSRKQRSMFSGYLHQFI